MEDEIPGLSAAPLRSEMGRSPPTLYDVLERSSWGEGAPDVRSVQPLAFPHEFVKLQAAPHRTPGI
jgi:hypothetical protein